MTVSFRLLRKNMTVSFKLLRRNKERTRHTYLNPCILPTKEKLFIRWVNTLDAVYVYASADALHARKTYSHLPKRTCRIPPDNGDASLRYAFLFRVCEDLFGIAPQEMYIGVQYTCMASCGLCRGNCGQDPISLRASAVECNERKRAYFKSHCRLNVLLQSAQTYGTSALSREFGGSCGATGGCPFEEVKKDGLSTGVLKLSSKGTKLGCGAIRFCGSFGGCSLDREKNGSNVGA